MSDTDKPGEAVDTQPTPQAESTASDSATENKATDTPADGQADAGKNEDAKSDAAPKGEPAKNSGEPQEFKPKSRNSAKQRIEQLARENAALRKQVNTSATKPPAPKDANDEGDPQPDEAPAPADDPKDISSEVARQLKPVLDQHRQQVDDTELAELFTGENAGKRAAYESRIRDAWKLEQYKDLAASDLLKLLDYDTALANAKTQAVEEYKKAQKDAQESSGAGNSNTLNRTGEGGKPIDQMSDEEFIAHNNKIKAGLTT
jgi:hypothetical protein